MAKSNENAIKEAAYFIWQNAGCPMGNDEYFWAMAVEQVNGKCNSSCKPSAKKTTAKKTSAAKKTSKK